MKEFVSLIMVDMVLGKNNFPVIIAVIAKRK